MYVCSFRVFSRSPDSVLTFSLDAHWLKCSMRQVIAFFDVVGTLISSVTYVKPSYHYRGT